MKRSIIDFFGQSLLIVFSILFALAANEWRMRASQATALNDAVIDLSAEIADNLDILAGVADYQRTLAKSITEAADGDITGETPIAIMKPVFGEVMREHERRSALGTSRPLQMVSWLTAKDRDVVARMDYDTAKKLAIVYESYAPIVTKNYLHMANQFSSSQMYVERDQKAMILQTASYLSESAARTDSLEHFLKQAQEALKEDYPDLSDP